MSNFELVLWIWAIGIAVVGPAFAKVSKAQDVDGWMTAIAVFLWPACLLWGFLKFGYGNTEAKK